ncbi:hypothetical protein HPP92_024953 [Vanilla planifolia]|uniref:Uncharacterized protein n=1 Tax=Vanilla planifolia TaxID=51239 RepID=A0A835PI62_VANPL|nr:hypothetical protein HPP92_024953 [Vanilla planifolia]
MVKSLVRREQSESQVKKVTTKFKRREKAEQGRRIGWLKDMNSRVILVDSEIKDELEVGKLQKCNFKDKLRRR